MTRFVATLATKRSMGIIIHLWLQSMLSMANGQDKVQLFEDDQLWDRHGGVTKGIITKFARHQPFILFRSKLGLHMFTDSETEYCYTDNSLYLPSIAPIQYMSYSVPDNYILWVRKSWNEICSKNLFQDEWNSAIRIDQKAECHSVGDLQAAILFASSTSRRAVYIMFDNGDIQISSISDKNCLYPLKRTSYRNASFLHITDFAPGPHSDFLLVGDDRRTTIYLLSPGSDTSHGAGQKSSYTLPEPYDRLAAIGSNQNGEIFLAIQRNSFPIVLKFRAKLANKMTTSTSATTATTQSSIFSSPDAIVQFEVRQPFTLVSFAVSNYEMAIMLLPGHNAPPKLLASEETYASDLYWLHFEPIQNVNVSPTTRPLVHRCYIPKRDRQYLDLLLIDSRMHDATRAVCDENAETICSTYNKDCDPHKIFKFRTQISYNIKEINFEMRVIGTMLLVLTLGSLLLISLHQTTQ